MECIIQEKKSSEKKVNKCPHGRQKSRCVDCGGVGICQHRKRRNRCKECKGSQICDHNRERYTCKDCHGAGICDHGNIKQYCRECDGNSFCEHEIRRTLCRECGGGSICEHDKIRSQCVDCDGSQICDHGVRRSKCIPCEGSSTCEHKKLKRRCKTCGGEGLCKSSFCETQVTNKYDGYCRNCFVHLFPLDPRALVYKTRETSVVKFILDSFPEYKWNCDKTITGGVSKRRPDMFLDLGYMVLVIEVDENRHERYEEICENRRMMEISQDIKHRSLVFMRFNPDGYIDRFGNKIKSCWSNKGNLLSEKEAEWRSRLLILRWWVRFYLRPENRIDKTIQQILFCYDGC